MAPAFSGLFRKQAYNGEPLKAPGYPLYLFILPVSMYCCQAACAGQNKKDAAAIPGARGKMVNS